MFFRRGEGDQVVDGCELGMRRSHIEEGEECGESVPAWFLDAVSVVLVRGLEEGGGRYSVVRTQLLDV